MTLKVTLANWRFITQFWEIWHVLSWCTRIGEHTYTVTLNELEGHSSVSGLFKCKSSTFVHRSNLQDFNWHARVARSLSDSWSSCKPSVGHLLSLLSLLFPVSLHVSFLSLYSPLFITLPFPPFPSSHLSWTGRDVVGMDMLPVFSGNSAMLTFLAAL